MADLGDRVVVGVSTDAFNGEKGKHTFIGYDHRSAVVKAIRYVDQVFAEASWAQKREDLIRFEADILVMGDDWAGRFDDLQDLCEVVYVARTANVSSSYLKMAIQRLNSSSRDDGEESLELSNELGDRLS